MPQRIEHTTPTTTQDLTTEMRLAITTRELSQARDMLEDLNKEYVKEYERRVTAEDDAETLARRSTACVLMLGLALITLIIAHTSIIASQLDTVKTQLDAIENATETANR